MIGEHKIVSFTIPISRMPGVIKWNGVTLEWCEFCGLIMTEKTRKNMCRYWEEINAAENSEDYS